MTQKDQGKGHNQNGPEIVAMRTIKMKHASHAAGHAGEEVLGQARVGAGGRMRKGSNDAFVRNEDENDFGVVHGFVQVHHPVLVTMVQGTLLRQKGDLHQPASNICPSTLSMKKGAPKECNAKQWQSSPRYCFCTK